jgi:hypothetical protein
MSQRLAFEGKIVRLERDGFGIVEFDSVIGSTKHGIFSTHTSEPGFPFGQLKEGMHVKGIAEVKDIADADDRSLAAIKTVELEPAF